jgi:hypothetical protein
LIEISDLAKGDCEILDESIILFLVNCAQKFESLGLLNFIPRIQAKLGRRKKPIRTEFEVFYTDIYRKLIAVIDDIERGHQKDMITEYERIRDVEIELELATQFKVNPLEWQALQELFLQYQTLFFKCLFRLQSGLYEQFYKNKQFV